MNRTSFPSEHLYVPMWFMFDNADSADGNTNQELHSQTGVLVLVLKLGRSKVKENLDLNGNWCARIQVYSSTLH